MSINKIEFGIYDKRIKYQERHGAYGIVINDINEALAIRFSKGLNLPGGGIEENETSLECLSREFIEETGYSIKNERHICDTIQYFYAKNDNIHYKLVNTYYSVELKTKLCLPIEDDHELEWISLNEKIVEFGLDCHTFAVGKCLKLLS